MTTMDDAESIQLTKLKQRTQRAEDHLREFVPLLVDEPNLTNFELLRKYFAGNIHRKVVSINPSVAVPLCTLLMRLSGKKNGTLTSSRLAPEAIVALELLYDFLVQVVDIQDAVERRTIADIKMLRLHRHFEEAKDERHKSVVVKFILYLTKNYRKFADFKQYTDESVLTQIEALLSQEVRVTPQASYISTHMTAADRLAPQGNYFDCDVETVCQVFRTSADAGLRSSEIASRQQQYGLNTLPAPVKPGPLRMLVMQLIDFMVIILIAAACVSLGIKDYKAAVTLFIVVIINVIIGFTQEYKAERALDALMSLSVPKATVIRDCRVQDIPSADLVPGDIVVLEEGDQVPADLRLIEVASLAIAEAALTGESVAIEKVTKAIREKTTSLGDRVNMAFMSTVVNRGRGKGIVVCTGRNTEIGKISDNISQAKAPKTPLQRKLTRLGQLLVVMAIVLCMLVVGIGIARKHGVEDMIKVGVSLAVSVIPEGLVAVTTVTMALGVQRMAKRNAIVRKLAAVEALGSVTTICSDKTGTLTLGKMTATQCLAAGKRYDIEGSSDKPDGGIRDVPEKLMTEPEVREDEALFRLLQIAVLCNNSTVQKKQSGSEDWEMLGDSTEAALMLATMRIGLSKLSFLNDQGYQLLTEFAFDSDRKRMTVVYRRVNGSVLILVKGALESVLKHCDRINVPAQSDQNGVQSNSQLGLREVPIETDQLAVLETDVSAMAAQGLRVIACAYRELQAAEFANLSLHDVSTIENRLVFLGVFGLMDPPRPNIQDSIALCRRAGVSVCMITGDHPTTATAIAHTLGIIDSTSARVLRGQEIDELVQSGTLQKLDPFPRVFARVSPDNKLQIVEALQKNKHITAMTGDGVNDAAAIRKADIGIAMGISGTDITKQTADIVLADDNFATIVVAIEEGRRVFANIKKFILYLLSCNTAEILVMLLGVIIDTPVPFTPIQILYANIIADIPPAISLGLDLPERDIMQRLPRDPSKNILTLKTIALILFQGLSMALISIGALLIAIHVQGYSDAEAQAYTFSLLTSVQLFHAFLSRSRFHSIVQMPPWSNLNLLAAVSLSVVLLIGGIYIPGVNTALNLLPLSAAQWGQILLAITIHVVLVETCKIWLRWRNLKKARRPHRIKSEAA